MKAIKLLKVAIALFCSKMKQFHTFQIPWKQCKYNIIFPHKNSFFTPQETYIFNNVVAIASSSIQQYQLVVAIATKQNKKTTFSI